MAKKSYPKMKVSPSNIQTHWSQDITALPAERAEHYQEGNAIISREAKLKDLGTYGRQGVDMPGSMPRELK